MRSLQYRLDVNTLHRDKKVGQLASTTSAALICGRRAPLFYDEYRHNRATGSFVLVNEQTNATVAAGMLLRPPA